MLWHFSNAVEPFRLVGKVRISPVMEFFRRHYLGQKYRHTKMTPRQEIRNVRFSIARANLTKK